MLGLVTLATTMTGLRRSDVTGTTIVTSVAAEMIDMSVAAENACRSTSIGTTTTDEGGEVAAAAQVPGAAHVKEREDLRAVDVRPADRLGLHDDAPAGRESGSTGIRKL